MGICVSCNKSDSSAQSVNQEKVSSNEQKSNGIEINITREWLENDLNSTEKSKKEKLWMTLSILKENTETGGEMSILELRETFMGFIDKYYHKLLEKFLENNESYKPLIKLLQVFELMLENFKTYDIEREILIKRFKSTLESFKDNDWRYLRNLLHQRVNLKIPVETKEIVSMEESLVQGFLSEMEKTRKALIWKSSKKCISYVERVIESLFELEKNNKLKFAESLIKGRFEKSLEKQKISFSLVIGDEGGLYLLLNSVKLKTDEEDIIKEAGVSEEFLRKVRSRENYPKVILGKGSFGKVRLALSIFGNLKVDIGQLVCIKKSLAIGSIQHKRKNPVSLANITDSCFEDFFMKNLKDSFLAPKPLDMAILSNFVDDKHRKAYLIMEIFPQNTADNIFQIDKYSKWEYQKSYILDVMKTMRDLLLIEGVFNSDLKPQNTLFDPHSRKMAIIDLGSSLFIGKNNPDVEKFDLSVGGFGKSDLYCPPEILAAVKLDSDSESFINLKKCISYLCGATIAEITGTKPKINPNDKENINNWKKGENTDLEPLERENLVNIINSLLQEEPKDRPDLEDAIRKVENIGSDFNSEKAVQEHYIEKAKELSHKNPSDVNLNADINDTLKKGIIKQYLVQENPKLHRKQNLYEIEKEFDEFFSKEDETIFLILGEAGSGKSLSIQIKFLQELRNWKFGNPIPIYFNMADEIDLERIFQKMNSKLGCNLLLDSKNRSIHLFIDSYDEGNIQRKRVYNHEELTSEKPFDISVEENYNKKVNLIQEYVKLLKNWKVVKIIISCRTDFVQNEGEDDVSDFMISKNNKENKNLLRVRYIAPIDYLGKLKGFLENSTVKLKNLVSEWLKREKIFNIKDSEIMEKIIKFHLKKKMNTGLMFNMIMNMLVSSNNDKFYYERPLGFEIYKISIWEEFNMDWKLVINNKQEKEKINILMKDLDIFIEENNSDLMDQKDLILGGVQKIGELLAAFMTINNKNRLNLGELEVLVGNSKLVSHHKQERTEWKSLYHVCKIMGLKLERRHKEIDIDNSDECEKEEIFLGFRHETYKNYFLLNGIKRILRKRNANKITSDDDNDELIIKAVLDKEENIHNFALMRLFGEEINYRDFELAKELRNLLSIEQEKMRKIKEIATKVTKKERDEINLEKNEQKDDFTKKNNANRRAAIIISLLVAGNFPFSGDDLSDLDLGGAYLRGGLFMGTTFERTILRKANLKHANLIQARFIEADIRNIYFGIWPDLIIPRWVDCFCFSPDWKKFAFSNSNTFEIYHNNHPSSIKQLKLPSKPIHKRQIECMCFSSDGKTLLCGSSDEAKVWDFENGMCIDTLNHKSWVHCVSISPNGLMIATGFSQSIYIWRLTDGKYKLLKDLIHDKVVNNICFSTDGVRLASCSDDHTLRIWEADSENKLHLLKIVTNSIVYRVSFDPSSNRVAGSVDNTINVWDSEKGNIINELIGHSTMVLCICFNSEGKRLASGSIDKTVRVWDSFKGSCLYILTGHIANITTVSFSPDGKWVAACRNKNVFAKFWYLGKEESIQTLKGHNKSVNCICFSPDGMVFASSSNYKVKIWDLKNGECTKTSTLVGF